MPNSIDEARVVAFNSTVNFLYQQQTSRTREMAGQEKTAVGKLTMFDRLGLVTATKRTNRNQPTNLVDITHSRRAAAPSFYDLALPVDPMDLDRIIIDPKSAYPQQIVASLQRALDIEMYGPGGSTFTGGMRGSSLAGENGTGTPVVLPAGQKVAHGGTGMTLAKIIAAAQILNTAEVPADDRYALMNSKGLGDLLAIQQLTSSDYNAVKLLMTGEIKTYMGFSWVLYNFVAETSVYYAVFLHKMAMGLAIPKTIDTSIDKRPDLSNIWQCYGCEDVGSVRIIDEGICEVAFQ
jgi:hypothetical protein